MTFLISSVPAAAAAVSIASRNRSGGAGFDILGFAIFLIVSAGIVWLAYFLIGYSFDWSKRYIHRVLKSYGFSYFKNMLSGREEYVRGEIKIEVHYTCLHVTIPGKSVPFGMWVNNVKEVKLLLSQLGIEKKCNK